MNKLTVKKKKKIIQSTGGAGDISVISLAWDLGWMIALPIVLLAIGGAILDKKFQSSPWFLLGGIGLAFVISSVMVYGKVLRAMADLSVSEDLLKDSKRRSNK